ncbi:MAG TPA: biopolymer transporter ExbD [Sedimentisphaerales bacterium]|nr:biopolymer transporter ExbD [Sedimentisphaerales bacterium]
MALRAIGQRKYGFQFCGESESGGLNVTPIIDIVFLLIIFFLVVCRFIEAENFPVSVPDRCSFAQSSREPGVPLTTVTVMRTENAGEVSFAVGPERIALSENGDGLVVRLAELIDARLRGSPAHGRTVVLRVDKDVCFADAQYALAGIAASCATDIELAALKDRSPDSR